MSVLYPAHLLAYDERMGQYHVTHKSVCVATMAEAGTFCGDPVYRKLGDIGLCVEHWDGIAQWREELPAAERDEMITDRRERELEYIRMERAHRLEVERQRRELAMIYYIRRDDGLIKIGTTWRVKQRMSALKTEHGALRLLLAHSGGYRREHDLHERFAELRVTGEWFLTRKRLTDWIRKCRLDPVLGSEQPAEVVSLDILREVCREGNIASRVANKADDERGRARAAELGRLRLADPAA